MKLWNKVFQCLNKYILQWYFVEIRNMRIFVKIEAAFSIPNVYRHPWTMHKILQNYLHPRSDITEKHCFHIFGVKVLAICTSGHQAPRIVFW